MMRRAFRHRFRRGIDEETVCIYRLALANYRQLIVMKLLC